MFNNIKEQKNVLIEEIKKLESNKTTLNEDINNMIIKKENILSEIESLKETKKRLNEEIINKQDFFVSAELKYVDSLSGLEFEGYCTDLLIKNGYRAFTTKASGDEGGDIIAEKNNIKYIIQCKNYTDSVGNKAIQEVYTAQGIYKADKSIVITNNYFTNQAIKEAQILDILLWDREYLKILINQAYDLYVTFENNKNSDSTYEQQESDDVSRFLKDAIEIVIETGQASTAFIQRKLIVSYSIAQKIIDKLEKMGIISEYQENRPRKVIATKDEWEKMKKEI